MKNLTKKMRATTFCLITVTAIALPGLSEAGWFNNAKDKVNTVKTTVKTRANKFVMDNELLKMIQQLKVKEQLQNTLGLLQETQRDYQYFSGGSGCSGECANFRGDLRGLIQEYVSLANIVPALRDNGSMMNNLERAKNLVDYLPARALYPLWQILHTKVEEMKTSASNIRETLASFPSIESYANMQVSESYRNHTNSRNLNNPTGARFNREYDDGPICRWVDDKPFVDLIQARLQQIEWALNSAANAIPDLEVKGEAGAAAGIELAAGVSIKPTDFVKMILNIVAAVPGELNWMIEINTLRAATVCQVIEYKRRALN